MPIARTPFELKGKRIFVAGHRGTVGSALARKLLDVGRLAKLGWRARTSLEDGIRLAYRAYLDESKQAAE